jgi:hypothetical protein
VSELVGYDVSDELFVERRGLVSHQQAGLSKGDQTPVLHRPRQKVWDSNQVWRRWREGRKSRERGMERWRGKYQGIFCVSLSKILHFSHTFSNESTIQVKGSEYIQNP